MTIPALQSAPVHPWGYPWAPGALVLGAILMILDIIRRSRP
jgi:hypothetical protein